MTRPWRHAYRDPAPPIRTDARPVSGAGADATAASPSHSPAVEDPARPLRAGQPASRADLVPDATLAVLEPIEDGLLAAADGAAAIDESAALARLLRRDPARLVVVVAGPAGPLVPDLARRLRPWVEQGWESIRLVASHAATAAGGSPPGQELADRLSVEVVAPDGQLLAVPDGSLFVVNGTAAARPGAWLHFRPGRAPVPAGPRFPAPDWQPDLAGLALGGVDDIVVEQVPAGLWAHRPGVVELTDLAFAMPVEAHDVVLLVSRAGDRPLPATRLRSVVAALPGVVRERLVGVPYGAEPVAGARLGAVLAAAAGRSVRVRTGLTVQVDQRHRSVVAVDAGGVPTWRPLVHELAWSPDGTPPRVVRRADHVDDLFAVGLGQHALNERWLVELVEAGLWIRPLGRPLGAEVVRQLPLDARMCTVVVGAPGHSQVRPPWRAIGRLLRLLPDEVRSRLRLAVPADAGHRLAQAAARACRDELAGRPAYLIDSAGDLVPLGSAPSVPNSGAPDPPPDAPRADAPRAGGPRGAGPIVRAGRSRPDRSSQDAAGLVAYFSRLQADQESSIGWEPAPLAADGQVPPRRAPAPPPADSADSAPDEGASSADSAPDEGASSADSAPDEGVGSAEGTPGKDADSGSTPPVIDAGQVVRPNLVEAPGESTAPARGTDHDGPATGQQTPYAG
jgi:hypothetical protein